MPSPEGLPTVRVHGKFKEPDLAGTPRQGTVSFTPSPTPITFTDQNVIISGTEIGTLDANGEFTLTLIATDTANQNPTGWTYTVTVKIIGEVPYTYQILLPYTDTSVNPVELADIMPTPTAPTYLPVTGPQGPSGVIQTVNGKTGISITLVPSDIGAIATSAAGAAGGVATLDGTTHVPAAQLPDLSGTYINISQKGAASGVATLDGSLHLTASQYDWSITAPPSVGTGVVGTSTKPARADHTHDGVALTGNQTIAGIKTFSSPPSVPTPVASGDAVPKTYVDGAGTFTGAKTYSLTNVGDLAIKTTLTGDTQPRYQLLGDGSLVWGPGNAAGDTTLYRTATGLRTTRALTVDGATTLTGAVTLGNTLTLPGGTVTPIGWLNVKSFGAVGNGSTNDTAAIQAALAAVSTNGSVVYFPPGSYKITSTLTVSISGTTLVGDGWSSQIIYDGSTVTPAINATGNIKLFMRDLRLSQSNASHLGTCLDLSQVNSGVFERLLIDGGGASGVAPLIGITMNAATCHYNSIRSSRVNYGGASSIGINLIGGSHSNTIEDVHAIPQGDDSASSGIYINGVHSTTLIHPDIESGAGNGIWLDTGSNSTTILNAYCEANNVNLKISSGVVGTVVSGGTFQTGTTANIQDNGSIGSTIMNAWPNSGSTSYNQFDLINTSGFSINGVPLPGATYQPSDLSFAAWAYDPVCTLNTSPTTSGTIYLAQVKLRYPTTLTKLSIGVATAASGVTANQNFLGLYNSAGTRVAQTAAGAIDTALASSGILTASLSSSYAAAPGTYWVAFVNNATTPATLGRGSGISLSVSNGGASSGNYRFAVNGTAATALPATITPGSNTAAGAITLWAAAS